MWRQFIRPAVFMPRNRQALEYNKNGDAWAVVTGGSDGIGLGFCRSFAQQGFNICIVSRNESKINEKLKELVEYAKKSGHDIKTMCVKADFSKMYTMQEYHDVIGSKLASLDVAILVLNAGIGQVGSVLRFEDSYIQDLCTINVLHVMYLAKIMAKQLSSRLEKVGQKSALIITSSIGGTNPIAGMQFYGGTKSLESYIAQGLHWEFKGKVDSISYMPSYVESQINARNLGGALLISADEAARSCLA